MKLKNILMTILLFLILCPILAAAETFQMKSATLYYIGNVEGKRYENLEPVVGFSNKSFTLSSLPYCEIINETTTQEFSDRFETRLKNWIKYDLSAQRFNVLPTIPNIKDVFTRCWHIQMNGSYVELSSNIGEFSFYFDGIWWVLKIDLMEDENLSYYDSELVEKIMEANRLHDVLMYGGAVGDTFHQMDLKPKDEIVILNFWDYEGSFECNIENEYEYYYELDCPEDPKNVALLRTICAKSPGAGVRSIEDRLNNFHIAFDETFFLLERDKFESGCFAIFNDHEILSGFFGSGWGSLLDLIDYLDFVRDNELAIKGFDKIKERSALLAESIENSRIELENTTFSSNILDTYLGIKVGRLGSIKKALIDLQKETIELDNDMETFNFALKEFEEFSSDPLELYPIIYRNRPNYLKKDISSVEQSQTISKDRIRFLLSNVNNETEIEIGVMGVYYTLTGIAIALIFSYLEIRESKKSQRGAALIQMISIELENRGRMMDILDKYDKQFGKLKKGKLSKRESKLLKDRVFHFLNFYEGLTYVINKSLLSENDAYILWSKIIRNIYDKLYSFVEEGDFEQLIKLINKWKLKYKW